MDTKRSFNLWDEPQLRTYLGVINRRCGVVETLALPAMRDLPPVKIETLFVPPLLSSTAVTADSSPESWPKGKSLLEELDDSPRLVILGDPGGGKTTLSNWIAWRITSGATAPLPSRLTNVLPLPCVLRELEKECFAETQGIKELANHIVSKVLGSARAEDLAPVLESWIDSGRFILILDGVDEIPLDDRVAVGRWMREAQRKDACVLATSRIVGYDDYPVDSSLRTAHQRIDSNERSLRKGFAFADLDGATEVVSTKEKPWAEVRFLMPFDWSQISDFSRNWYRQRCASDKEAKEKTSDLLAALNQSEVTVKLARTPNLLSLMAIVHRERAHLPDGKALLYEEIVNAYINTIDSQRKIIQGDILGSYNWREKKSWLSYVGFKMQCARKEQTRQNVGILVSEKQVISWIEESMKVSGVRDTREVACEFLDWVARRSGLLLPRGEGYYAFVHLSFQEYFCACHLEVCVVSPDFADQTSKKKSDVHIHDFAQWADKSHWLETLIFLFEILSNERSPKWVESLAKSTYPQYPQLENIFGAKSSLAGRLLSNKHIKLSRIWLDYLATVSCLAAYQDWDSGSDELARVLISSGYALVLGEEIDEESSDEKFNRLPSSSDVFISSNVRFLISRGGVKLTHSFLSEFTQLRALCCSGVELVDLSAANSLKYLETLVVENSQLINAECIAKFKKLFYVEFKSVRQSGLEEIKSRCNVRFSAFHEVELKSLGFLAYWKKLQTLHLEDINVVDVSALKALTELEFLNFTKMPVYDVSCLSRLKSLDYLCISDCPVDSLSCLSGNRKINTLSLKGLKISSLDFVSKMAGLQGLFVDHCPIDSFSGVASTELRYLFMNKLSIESIEGVERLTGLHSLVLRDLSVKEVSAIGNLKSLELLRLDGMPIETLDWVKGLSNLIHLGIVSTSIQDLSPLLKLKKLKEVVVGKDDGYDMQVVDKSKKITFTAI
ncbi:NACHT domain-containing protein [Pseudomonas sp. JQ170]|uniref:NACHT domain-containing protein n=1 Tax=unclassified Pseudomonas TaxID=196821 RepID=UPI00265173CD|nr:MULTISPECIES: NACHT domain-containing protein [unclassified Pseudomonas]MDN7142721.1 NACHT domain-containing protein [Pseudomonas sp. JQ170]WRO77928.1 NACHT domain-containing protein [Pseudomonas sp. 170C]